MIYVLAKLPHIQDKLREEIIEVIGEKEEISYEDLTKLKYLHQVMLEVLRMYPPTTRYPNRIIKFLVRGVTILG
jgi:cytochrome P450